jgi:hypothetical protein
MTGVWIGAIIIFVITLGLTIWVTNKAYSRKWEEEDGHQ